MVHSEAAQHLVAKIRQEHTLNGTIGKLGVGTCIRQSLKLISEQLYQKSTHFLLEVLQNADDNHFDSPIPTLCIEYKPGSLRIDCNEAGFNDRNVEAICAIGGSTKTGPGCFTGEKGIGFKSVFKVSDAVWISSRDYNFKLDTREDGELGMIAPQWDDFPEPSRNGYTSFYLRLSDKCDEDNLIHELSSFDPRLLMFLRRIKQVELRVTRNDGTIWTESVQRDDQRSNGHITLTSKRIETKYITRIHPVANLPVEPKRVRRSRSEIILAFPLSTSGEELHIESQKVYTFLPIKDYGFKFMIQADFILTASREAIDESCEWNRALRDELPRAFVDAVDHFNSGPLRYHWTPYIPHAGMSTFFNPTKTEIIHQLSDRKVLESCSGTLEKPTTLTYVPPEYKDSNGIPLTLDPDLAATYLSSKYPAYGVEALICLGVKPLSPVGFLQDLQSINRDLPRKAATWHSQLARVLLPLVNDERCSGIIRKLSLVPLRLGEWACMQGRQIYFSRGSRGLNIPSGVEIAVVDSGPAVDEWRTKLFEQLGVKECDTTEVCRAILNGYCGKVLSFLSLTRGLERQELVAQTAYLYKSAWRTPEIVHFWFATTDGKHSEGRQTYVRKPVDNGSPQERVYDLLQTKFPFLHEDYVTSVNKTDRNWRRWLLASFGVSSIPRLTLQSIPETEIDSIHIGSSSSITLELSEEIRLMFAEGNSSDALWFLRENWKDYSKWLEHELFPSISGQVKRKFLEDFGCLNARCRNGQSVPLHETLLPSMDSEVERHPNICILEVQDIANPKWSFLNLFGVKTKKDVSYYVRCLELLRNAEFDKHLIVHIYERIQELFDENEKTIRYTFHEKSLMCLPQTVARHSRSLWLTARKAFNMLAKFEKEYPTCIVLLRGLIREESGKIGLLLGRAAAISNTTKLCEMSQTFRDLNATILPLSPRKAQTELKSLTSSSVFPVVHSLRKEGFDYLSHAMDVNIFIADHDHLADSFRGIVPLLAFPSKELSDMRNLFSNMKAKWQSLSKVVRSEVRPVGRRSVHHGYTTHYRARSCFLQALVPSSHPNRQKLCDQIAQVEAAVTSRIVKLHSIKTGTIEKQGSPREVTAASSVAAEKLQLFLTEQCIATGLPNVELTESIGEHFQITEPTHMLLLNLTLSEASLQQVRIAFQQHNLSVVSSRSTKEALGVRKRAKRFAGSSVELHTISSPFTDQSTKSKEAIDEKYDESLDGFHLDSDESKESTRRKRKRQRRDPEDDRGLPFLSVIKSSATFPSGSLHSSNERLQYIGQLIANSFLEKHLGSPYVPALHWSSHMRERASYSSLLNFQDTPDFCLTEESSEAMSSFLANQGHRGAGSWLSARPQYYIETAITAGSWQDCFSLSTRQFERIRRHRLQPSLDGIPKHVCILMRISRAYTDPIVGLYMDPWQLLASDRLCLTGDASLRAKLAVKSNALFTSSTLQDFPRHEYKYKPILGKQIRLLHLLPSDKKETPLKAAIAHVTLEDPGDFRALSYVWGSEHRSCRLETLAGYLGITSSLRSALRHLRRKHEPITLWVDAICINQDDNEEKASQIRLLPHVFQLAMSTLAFLGEDAINDHAIETLMQIGARAKLEKSRDYYEETLGDLGRSDRKVTSAYEMQSTSAEIKNWPKLLPFIPSSWADRSTPPLEDPVWKDIERFFNNLWFRRAWVVQEIVLASTVRIICGKWVIDWNDLFAAVEVIDHERCTSDEYSTLRMPWENFLQMATHREREARKSRTAFIGLLESFRDVESTMARDRFFALRALAADCSNPAFESDYNSPLEDIVCRLGHAFIAQGKILLLLYRAGLAGSPGEGPARFPSWIPNWTVSRPPCLWESSHRGVQFAASWKAEPRCRKLSLSRIAVHGVGVDIVTKVSTASCSRDQLWAYLREVDEMVERLESEHYKDKAALKWKVPVAGARYPRTTPDVETDLQASYQALRKVLQFDYAQEESNMTAAVPTTISPPCSQRCTRNRPKPSQIPTLTHVSSSGMGARPRAACENYKRALFECLENWRFFVTERGYVGVGPALTQEDDLVSIFDGSAVPFLVRAHDSRSGETESRSEGQKMANLVGECYVHGLMNGEAEALRELESGWFSLC